MKEFVKFGINQHYEREKEIEQFKHIIDTARNNCAEKSRRYKKL